ncbi:MAG: hypothetical protein R6X34_02035 [Chloroflexota bacterium]
MSLVFILAASACSSTVETTPEATAAPIEAAEIAATAVSTSLPPATSEPTATASPTAVPTILPTATPSPTATPIPSPSPIPVNQIVNGIPLSEFLIMPDNVAENVRSIYARGVTLGRNPHRFSKIGDSVVLTPHFLARFDSDNYNLGLYDSLQPTIDQFAGSFSRYGQAAKVGLSFRTMYELGWPDEATCKPEEDVVACEIRTHNPSIFLIRLGTNDAVPAAMEANLRQLLTDLIAQGIVPVLGAKNDRFDDEKNVNNQIVRDLAAEFETPLWDFDIVADTLPLRGLSGDGVHLTMHDTNDYTNPEVLERGYPVNDLTALMVLDAVLKIVTEE